ncbi:hypothetical protein [Melghirimyces thermohalophilus]|uniref:hypothetical protein n=1 Tax=Melghirimyces thermohalophilus TaxID=1236220 RepID=UPI000B88A1E1|nr:hypothetical protein [Melghirimyces thermohalophilus]
MLEFHPATDRYPVSKWILVDSLADLEAHSIKASITGPVSPSPEIVRYFPLFRVFAVFTPQILSKK